jgi:PKD repeat protein
MYAERVSIQTAKQVAQNLLRENSLDLYSNSIELQSTINNNIYIFNSSNATGFTIIAADTKVLPILGYSFNSNFDPENIPPALQELIDLYDRQIADTKTQNLLPTDYVTSQWEKYTSKNFTPDHSRDTVGPLITSIWNQLAYYNTLCPEDENGYDGHVPVGCVATAMAQIMDYYEYPSQGIGSHTYEADGYGTQTANFGVTTYNWDNIPDYLTDYNIDVQTLCYHCGVSVEMYYGPNGSGAASENVGYALNTYFDYATTMQYIYKDEHNEDEWKQILKDEIDNLRPIHYSGFSETSGHAFICDGYDGDNYFHFNWGWDGLFNGYYTLDNLNPRQSNYTISQSALIGIKPNTTPEANFVADNTTILPNSSVNFTDLSSHVPTSWNWNFEGATPSTSDAQNPQNITYSQPGVYQVTLEVSNDTGDNTEVKTNYITVAETALPIADFTIQDSVIAQSHILEINNKSHNAISNYTWEITPNLISFVEGTDNSSENPKISFNSAGIYEISLTVTNSNGTHSMSKSVYVGGFPLPYHEDFELSLGNTGWSVTNPDDNYSWDGCYFGGGYEIGEKSAYINCFKYTETGERDGLISPLINLRSGTSPELTFKHAYAANGSHQDSLIIYIKTNENTTWERIFAISEDQPQNFATHTPLDERFTPKEADDWSGNDWGADDIVISLEPWTDNSDVQIKFEAYNDNGNCIFIDDVKILATPVNNETNIIEPTSYSLKNYPNPFNPTTMISFSLDKKSNVNLSIYNVKGQKIKTLIDTKLNSGEHSVIWNGKNDHQQNVGSGVYFLKMRNGRFTRSKKMILLK